jgi:hypothetical protein
MRNVMAACCATVMSVAALSAQSGTMNKMSKDMDMKGAAVMMTGCVAAGTGDHYMLTNAMKTGDDMKGEMKGGMKDGMKPMSYALMGTDLKAHVGHKVAVTGMMADKMAMDGKMDPAMDHGKMGKDKSMPGDMQGSITVQSIKMVSPTCP